MRETNERGFRANMLILLSQTCQKTITSLSLAFKEPATLMNRNTNKLNLESLFDF